MYRALAEEAPRSSEEDWAFQLESPHFITLGLVYDGNPRFAGGAFAPILKRVDRFLKGRLPATLEERGERAAQVVAADEALAQGGGGAQEAGDQPSLPEELPARAHEPADARAQEPALLRADLHAGSWPRSRRSTWRRCATRTSAAPPSSRRPPASELALLQVQHQLEPELDARRARGDRKLDRDLDLGRVRPAPVAARGAIVSLGSGSGGRACGIGRNRRDRSPRARDPPPAGRLERRCAGAARRPRSRC